MTSSSGSPPTVRDQLLARADDDRPGLLWQDRRWSWREVVRESCRRSAAIETLLSPARPPHVGVLLPNCAEFVLLLGAAALGGQVVVGLNSTRRGDALVADLRRTDVQVVLTDTTLRHLLPDDPGVPVIEVDSPSWRELVDRHREAPVPSVDVRPEDLFVLVFTSGTSGDPKAVRVTHRKVTGPGVLLGERFGLGTGDVPDVSYVSMPLFHSNALMAGWAPALATATTVAVARFSASGFIDDVRRCGATYASYVGKPLTYVLDTPEAPDDADNPLRLVFGNEANEGDIAAFARRFGCEVVDSYSSSENAVVVQRRPGMPPGSLGMPLPGIAVLDPETGRETPDARFDDAGRLLNADEAVGELVNTTGAGAFDGYYNDPDAEAERMRGGMYWSGDLAYRDADGWVYFAGRSGDWLRVDGENLASAPIERLLLRHPAIAEAAVYAVPDPRVGDRVAAALVLRGVLDPDAFAGFLAAQQDLSTTAWPSVVRVFEALPRTATSKVLKRELPTWHRGVLETWHRADRTRVYLVDRVGDDALTPDPGRRDRGRRR